MRLALALVALLVGPASAAPKPKTGPKKKPPAPIVVPSDYGVDADAPPKPLGPAPTAHKEGEYGGVEPGQTPTATGKKHKAPAKNTLNWVGFEAKDGGASVFFQAANPFEVTQHVEGSQLVAMLTLPRMGPNAWRALDTRFFENPLSRIDAKAVSAHGATKTAAAHAAGIEVRFSFKTAADAKEAAMRTTTEADGQSYVYLTFPQGTAAPTVKDPERSDKSDKSDKPLK